MVVGGQGPLEIDTQFILDVVFLQVIDVRRAGTRQKQGGKQSGNDTRSYTMD